MGIWSARPPYPNRMGSPAAIGMHTALYPNANARFSFTVFITAFPVSSAAGTLLRSLFMRTMSADSMATSVPAPTAIPTSAWESAGASFIPSPTIATRFWAIWRSLTSRSLSPGFIPERTLSMPSSDAMASAAALPSPVAIMTSMPSSLRERTAPALSGLRGSDISTEPANSPPADAIMQVIPLSS